MLSIPVPVDLPKTESQFLVGNPGRLGSISATLALYACSASSTVSCTSFELAVIAPAIGSIIQKSTIEWRVDDLSGGHLAVFT
jgi:hypothetical protein